MSEGRLYRLMETVADGQARTEERLIALTARIDALAKEVRGNGKPGLLDRMSTAEALIAAVARERQEEKEFRQTIKGYAIKGIIGAGAVGVVSIGLWYVGIG